MSIIPFSLIPANLREWSTFFQQAKVTPSADTVSTSILKDNSVTTSKIVALNVTGAKLATDAVSSVKVQDNAITDAKLRDSAAVSIVGRAANTAGDPADIASSADDQFLVRRAGALTWGALAEADVPAAYLTQTEGDARYRELTDAVTYGELTGTPAALALLFSGTGSPETVVTAGVGSLYLRTDGGANTTLYVKESGAGNSGWIAK